MTMTKSMTKELEQKIAQSKINAAAKKKMKLQRIQYRIQHENLLFFISAIPTGKASGEFNVHCSIQGFLGEESYSMASGGRVELYSGHISEYSTYQWSISQAQNLVLTFHEHFLNTKKSKS